MRILTRKTRPPQSELVKRLQDRSRNLIGWTVKGDGGEPIDDLLDEAASAIGNLEILLVDCREKLEAAEAEAARLQHYVECADTPLMRDVLTERDEARAELKTASIVTENALADAVAAKAEIGRLREILDRCESLTPIEDEEPTAAREPEKTEIGEEIDERMRVYGMSKLGDFQEAD